MSVGGIEYCTAQCGVINKKEDGSIALKRSFGSIKNKTGLKPLP